MHITKLELENIKSYEHAVFEFERGTTAIMGENGAGKTTLIEAVAWTLFDLLDYKKDDFLKRGAKRGLVRLEFESGLDERRYTIQRDTRTAYFVYDPRLDTRIADKKEEVTRFLWQHLGVEPGTDLETLFRRAIGVPQGTFTAIFLETPTERKKAFDKLLKVEEYRVGAMKLGQTSKHIERLIIEVLQSIARAEGQLSNRDRYRAELKTFSKSVKEFDAQLSGLTKELKKHRKIISALEKSKAGFDEAQAALEKTVREKNRLELIVEQNRKDLDASKKAFEIVGESKEAHSEYEKSVGMLKELERERTEREKLQAELNKIKTALAAVVAEQKAVKQQLEAIDKQQSVLKDLEPLAKKQRDLESEKKRLEESVGLKRQKAATLRKVEAQVVDLRKQHAANSVELKAVREFVPVAENAPLLKVRAEKLTNELAAARARIERDREFQRQVENGMCPILSARCLNLKDDETLDGFLNSRFSDLESAISELRSQQESVNAETAKAFEAQKKVSNLVIFEKRKAEIENEGIRLKNECDLLSVDTKDLAEEETRLAAIEKELNTLGDPAGKAEYIRKDFERVRALQTQSSNIESNFERLESDRRLKVEQLETYKDLDSNWAQFTKKRDESVEAHTRFIKNETLAISLPQLEKEASMLSVDIGRVSKNLVQKTAKAESAAKDFDAESYQKEAEALRLGEIQFARITSDAGNTAERKAEIEAELENLKETENRLAKDKVEKSRLGKLAETVTFIRSTLKSAAPRVAKNYVYHVSVEANALFRDITGNAESTLHWTDDYGIELEEDGYRRPFLSMSGGEQMSAALAVRLALLRQLSEVRIAFFDEPTANMDLERRERLAEQISRITENQTFDQLFVISHDDTFENYADHVLSITE